MSVSPVGLGTTNAGLAWDAVETARILETYLDMGGSLVDTAHVYSDWVKPERARSERALGDWLTQSGKRNRIVLMTKGGHPDITQGWELNKSRMTKADMQSDLDSSLQKLRTDRIDISFYHRDDETQPVADLIEVMQEFVDAGKIRYYACSNWTTARMKEAGAYCAARNYRGFVANQAMLNLATAQMKPPGDDTMRVADDEMRRYHKETPGNLLIPFSGLCGGYFTRYIEQGPESVTGYDYDTDGNRRLAKKVKALMSERGISVPQVLLGYFSTFDFTCVPLFSAGNLEHLKEVMVAADKPCVFTEEDFG
jgi:aryl-alcohol dehydrogenase-like predicted oxidoreductase